MQTVGLYFLGLQPNAVSPTSKLLAHLSSKFPEQEHQGYSIDHRLFGDTSSQLPGSDPTQRAYTQILTLSSTPTKTYVGSTQPATKNDTALITIPHASVDSFTGLLATKLQPQWFHRQSVAVEGGTTLFLKNGEFKISIGDVRVSGRSQPGAGSLRGMIIEARHLEEASEERNASTTYEEADQKQDQHAFGSMLNALFKGTGESFDESKIHVRQALRNKAQGSQPTIAEDPEWEIAKLYMEVLRGTRS